MKIFSGFPSGKLRVTPVPNLFFTELLAEIDDLAELKITLHLIWLFAHEKNRRMYVGAGELRADGVLMQSLSAAGEEPEQALSDGLARAVRRGTLLHLNVSGDDLYFFNSEWGRRAADQMRKGQLNHAAGAAVEPATPQTRPNIFFLYEQNIGLLTPMISEELKQAELEYPIEWIQEAFKIAVDNNKRSWSYARKVLERWKAEGRGENARKGKPWYGDEYGKFVKR